MASSSCCASPSSVRICSVSAASASSMRLMAKPTWIRTQSPTQASTRMLGVDDAGDIDLPPHAADVDGRELLAGVVDLDDPAWDSEAHGCHSLAFIPRLDARRRAFRCVNETRGADRRLPERQSAIVGGNLSVGEHAEAARARGRGRPPRTEPDSGSSRPTARSCRSALGRRRRARRASVAMATTVLARPLWKRAAISGVGVPRMRSPRIARHIAAARYRAGRTRAGWEWRTGRRGPRVRQASRRGRRSPRAARPPRPHRPAGRGRRPAPRRRRRTAGRRTRLSAR